MKKTDFNTFFLIKKTDYDIIKLLDTQQKGELFNAIFEYQVNNKEINLTDDKTKIIFYHMKDYFDDNAEKYNKRIKNTKSKAGIISGIKRSREYKQLLTEKEQQEYLQNKLNELLNEDLDLTEINRNLTEINTKDDVLKCIETETNTSLTEKEHNLTDVNFVSNKKLTNTDTKINTNTDTKIDIDEDKTSSSIILSSSYFCKIETLSKFEEWLKWWRTNDDLEFEKWKKDNCIPDELLREKIQAVREYYSQPQNHTKDFKEALKKFIINDLDK